jgi:hypothetical protein
MFNLIRYHAERNLLSDDILTRLETFFQEQLAEVVEISGDESNKAWKGSKRRDAASNNKQAFWLAVFPSLSQFIPCK